MKYGSTNEWHKAARQATKSTACKPWMTGYGHRASRKVSMMTLKQQVVPGLLGRSNSSSRCAERKAQIYVEIYFLREPVIAQRKE